MPAARLVATATFFLAMLGLATSCVSETDSSAVRPAEATAQAQVTESLAVAEEDGDRVTGTQPEPTAVLDAGDGCPTLTLVTHDSFLISDDLFESFTDRTCIEVKQVAAGDAGQLVSTAILTSDNPTGDVLFGIDNTFLQRGLDADLFLPYASPLLSDVDDSLKLDAEFRVTPIDYGDVCANYWLDALGTNAPTSLDDLTDPAYLGQFVTENPETSSPGFAFLLATIVRYGDGWESYWQALVDNDVLVTAGWEEAYWGEYLAAGGSRPIVMSYASSPVAEVVFADPPIEEPPSGVLFDSCFRQIEFAGVLKGTPYPRQAQILIDFMLSTEFQQDIPLNMFVYPANSRTVLPAEFMKWGRLSNSPLTMHPVEVELGREEWTERWVEIVLG